MTATQGTGEAAVWCASADPCTAEARVQARVRVALEAAVRQRVSSVVIDRDGRIQLTDPLTAALDRLHGHALAAWTFAPERWETVSQDEIDYATAVLLTAWQAGRANSIGRATEQPSTNQTGSNR